MSRLLVTGATGVLGRRVVQRLRAAGHDVVATARSAADGVVPADLSSSAQAHRLVVESQPEVVVHLAGGQAPSPQVYAANIVPTVHLLDALRAAAPDARVLVTGSAAEYGEGAGTPIAETALCRPVNDYGRAKLAQTSTARAMADAWRLQLLVVRPFNVVAGEMPASSPLGNVRRQLLAGQGRRRTVVCGRTDVRRDFVAADDVAAVVAGLAEQWPQAPVLNLCSGHGVTLGEVLAGLARALEVEVDVVHDPDLTALPAPDSVVGDPARLLAVGRPLDGSVARVVAALVADDPT